MNNRDSIEKTLESVRERKLDLEREWEGLPDGELYVYNDNNCLKKYYVRYPKTGNRKKERRVGIKKNPKVLAAMVRKEYITGAIKLLEGDIKLLEHVLKFYKPSDENSIMAEFVEKHPELEKYIYHGMMSDEEWAQDYEQDTDYHAEELKSVASNGSMRRSKGEIIISSRLDHYGIPYRYEAPIGHPDLSYIPDFTIRRKRDGKIIYWEHLGRVNDEEYMQHNRRKLDDYELYGIVPWSNLILTYDMPDGGINERLIDGMIQGWLL